MLPYVARTAGCETLLQIYRIVQIQVGLKRARRTPATYLQWLSYEKVRRPDVLYGFPNGIASMPFASLNIPAWLEGTAQYQRKELSYDKWDAHRDMVLRIRVLSNSYFNLPEMGTFASKTSIERETVYNQVLPLLGIWPKTSGGRS